MHFLLLQSSNYTKNVVLAIEKYGHTYEHVKPNNLYLYVSETESGHDRIYNGDPDLPEPVRLKAKHYDCVISRIGSNLAYGASILMHLSDNLGIYAPQTANGLLTAQNKMKTTQILSQRGIKTPRTIMAKNPIHVDFLVKKIGGLPAVAKLLSGSQGVGVMILESATQTNTTLESFAKLEADVLLQAYVESGAKDYRAIVIGDEVVVAMERTGKKDFRANLKQGGSGRIVELSQADKDLCVRTAKAVGLSFAGIDLIKDANGTSFVIEANGCPGEGIIKITGVNYFENLIKFCEKKGKIQKEIQKNIEEFGIKGKQTILDALSQPEDKLTVEFLRKIFNELN
jgi:ribosomal protein S6--L-glutamate ligase